MEALYPILILLGAVQGVTEFLPVSSSGHLVILQQIQFIKTKIDGLGDDINILFVVALHVASLIAVIIYLRKDIITIVIGFFKGIFTRDFSRPEVKAGFYIIVASIPAAIIGLLFNDFLEEIFSSAFSAFILLIINGIILILTKKISIKNRKLEEIGLVRSLTIGIFQAIAILPGISRSGMTIAGGMLNGLEPVESARFSFLMSIPVILGAGLLKGIDAAQGAIPTELLMPITISMIVTVIVALLSLKLLFALVKRIKIDIFGYYTFALGICGIVLLKIL